MGKFDADIKSQFGFPNGNDEWADIQKPGPADGTCGGANQVWDAPLKGNLYQLKKLRERKYKNFKLRT